MSVENPNTITCGYNETTIVLIEANVVYFFIVINRVHF